MSEGCSTCEITAEQQASRYRFVSKGWQNVKLQEHLPWTHQSTSSVRTCLRSADVCTRLALRQPLMECCKCLMHCILIIIATLLVGLNEEMGLLKRR